MSKSIKEKKSTKTKEMDEETRKELYYELRELDEEIKLREHKVDLYSYYQSGLFLNDQIPFNLNELPDVFTRFRKEIESREVKPIKPSPINQKIKTIKSWVYLTFRIHLLVQEECVC